jgi:hypothetical protein
LPAGRTPEVAARLFLQALGSAVSCVSTQRLDVSTNAFAAAENHTIAFLDPVSLRAPAGGPSGLFFDVAHVFAIVETERARFRQQWRVTTRMYEYRLLDYHLEELLVYHWQPGADFEGPDHPHLHVSTALNAQVDAVTRRGIDLDNLHVATSRVSLEAIVRMLITEFRVAPQRHDWRETLDRTEAAFRDEAAH